MFKKIISTILSVAVIAVLFCVGAVSASAESYDVYKGDTIQYIFSAGVSDNVAGVAVDAWYSTEYLKPVDGVLLVGNGYVNTEYKPGAMKWNFIIMGGRAFNNEDVVTITFTVLKSGYLSDLGLSYNCVECFNDSLQDVSDNFNTFITTRIVVEPTGERPEPATDSEVTLPSDTDTNGGTDNTPSTDTHTDNTTDSVNEPNTDTASDVKATDSDKDSDTSSDKSSDTTSDTDTASDSLKPETEIDPGVEDSSDTATESGSSDTSLDTSNTDTSSSFSTDSGSNSGNAQNNNTSAIQTAGTTAIIVLVLLLVGAGGILFITKRNRMN